MHPLKKILPVVALVSLVLGPSLATAQTYSFRVTSQGVKSPLTAPTLGSFSVPAKNVGDSAFALTAPTSSSPGTFSYASSAPSVATVSGNVVTVVGIGTTTITATQAKSGLFEQATTSAVLTVSAALPYGFFTLNGLTWSMPAGPYTYSAAAAYCAGTINGMTGWRMPIQSELASLYANRATTYQGKWTVVSSSAQPYGGMRGSEITSVSGGITYRGGFRLGLGDMVNYGDNAVYQPYVTCVHP